MLAGKRGVAGKLLAPQRSQSPDLDRSPCRPYKLTL